MRWKEKGEKWSDWSSPYNTSQYGEEFDRSSSLYKLTEHFDDGSKNQIRLVRD